MGGQEQRRFEAVEPKKIIKVHELERYERFEAESDN